MLESMNVGIMTKLDENMSYINPMVIDFFKSSGLYDGLADFLTNIRAKIKNFDNDVEEVSFKNIEIQ